MIVREFRQSAVRRRNPVGDDVKVAVLTVGMNNHQGLPITHPDCIERVTTGGKHRPVVRCLVLVPGEDQMGDDPFWFTPGEANASSAFELFRILGRLSHGLPGTGRALAVCDGKIEIDAAQSRHPIPLKVSGHIGTGPCEILARCWLQRIAGSVLD